MFIKRFATLGLTIGAFVLVGLTTASSQGYPSRPITLIVPYSPGGPTDSLARILIDHMRLSLGQSIVIENVTGAGGSIGVGRVARAIPDGYTFGIGQVREALINAAMRSFAAWANVFLLSKPPAHSGGRERMGWCRQADASVLRARYRFASANSENTWDPFLAMPR